MTLNNYLVLALLVAACIPLLDVIATWYYVRYTKLTHHFSIAFPWVRSDVAGSRLHPELDRAEDAFVDEGGRTEFRPKKEGLRESEGGSEMDARMKDLTISFDGRQCIFSGYRYDRLPDAIRYAELTEAKERSVPRS